MKDISDIQLGSRGAALDDVVAVARGGAQVRLAAEAHAAMARSAALVDGFVAGNTPVYGVTTGFGSLASTVIPAERISSILPPRVFHDLTVEEGGVGAGTVIRFGMRVLGVDRWIRARITEWRPGAAQPLRARVDR